MQWLPLSKHTAQTSPGTTRFFLSIHLLHLPYMIPCSYRASACEAVLPSCMAFYVISVRQTRDLPVVSLFPHPASFRFHLAMDTLAFGYILPTTGRIRDLHPLETCAAGRTSIKETSTGASFYMLRQKRAVCICSTASVNIFCYCRIFHRKPVLMSETDPLFSIRSPVTVSSGKCRSR